MSTPITEAGGTLGRVSLVDVNRPVGLHAHPPCHALFKLAGDDSEFAIAHRRHRLSERTAVLVNAWQPHGFPFRRGLPGRARVLGLYIEPTWLSTLERTFGAAVCRDFFAAAVVALPDRTWRTVRALAEELGRVEPDPVRACARLSTVACELMGRYSRHKEIPAWRRSACSAAADRRIRRAVEIITERAAAPLCMGAVAREVALSRPHFFELFRRNLGISPGAYRGVMRMEHAYRALLETAPARLRCPCRAARGRSRRR